jgi:hypothetical protein
MHSSRRFEARQSESFTRRKREFTLYFWMVAVLAVFSWVAVISHLSFLRFFTINVIEIKGVSQGLHSTVRAAANEAISGDYFNLLSRSNILIYPKQDIEERIKQASARVEEVQIERHGLTSIFITVKEKDPEALVCANFPDFDDRHQLDTSEDQCAFADEGAVLYDYAPAMSGTMYNRYYIPDLGGIATSTIDQMSLRATSTEVFGELQNIYERMKKQGIEVKGILFKPNGEYEAYVANPKVNDEEVANAVIYFNSTRPLDVQLSNLILFWTHAMDDAKSKGRVPVYEYIDVRYGSNVFFRESERE